MGKKGFILCNCQGICPSFKKMDVMNVLNDIRREKIFDYVCLHPQLCVGDGEEFLKVLLAGKQTDRIYICLLYTSPSPRDGLLSRMPSSA